MKSVAILCTLVVLLPRSAVANEELELGIGDQVKAARAVLDPWLGKPAEEPKRFLHLVYWTPEDREPAQNHVDRLTRIMEHIREFYATEMERLGFGRRSFNLKYNDEKKLVIHVVRGEGPYADYDVQSGGKIRKECLPTLRKAGIDADRETILIFCNMADWDAEKRILKHKSPYYASGSHRQGTAWQLDSPILDARHLGRKDLEMLDGQYGRISLGKHNSIFIGGIAHELGHALGLPHNKERPDEKRAFGTALMGSGNRTYGDELREEGRGSFLTLAHGLRLASHPQFSGSTRGMSFPVKNDFSEIAFEEVEGGFEVSGTVTGNPPVYAVVAYMDPEGGQDYDATTATAVPDAKGRFTVRCTALRKGKPATLRLFALHSNGAVSGRMSQTKYSWPYRVDGKGKADLSQVKRRMALRPMIEAARFGDEQAIAEAFEHLHKHAPDEAGGKTHRIGKRLAAGNAEPEYPEPRAMAKETAKVPLADTTPSEARVGLGLGSLQSDSGSLGPSRIRRRGLRARDLRSRAGAACVPTRRQVEQAYGQMRNGDWPTGLRCLCPPGRWEGTVALGTYQGGPGAELRGRGQGGEGTRTDRRGRWRRQWRGLGSLAGTRSHPLRTHIQVPSKGTSLQ